MSLPRCPFYSKAIYKFNTTWIKIPGAYLAGMEKSVLKTYEILGPQISKTKQSWTWSSLGLSLPFGTNWNANVIKPWCRWGRTDWPAEYRPTNRHAWPTRGSTKVSKLWGMTVFQGVPGKPAAHVQGVMLERFYTICKRKTKKFKTDQKLKSLKNLWCVCVRICRCTCGYVH